MITASYSVATFISGKLIIFMGKAVDRFGQRKMLLIVSIALAATTFYGSFVSSFVMILVSYFFLRYFGQGSVTLILNSLVPQWFEKNAHSHSVLPLWAI
ncbi:MAG: MFS transporter [Acholeplasmataceae bacterium]|nr:MFS transporter [Acholeplasmataceae bacterium]